MKFPVTLSEKQRAKIARHFMQGGSCGFATRESVLVAYVLANYSDFKNLEVTERIKIRHSCELFVNGMISGDQLNNMALSCYTGMHRAFQILVNSVSWPLTTFVRDQMSKIDETVLLLASHGTKFWQPVCMSFAPHVAAGSSGRGVPGDWDMPDGYGGSAGSGHGAGRGPAC